jgi:class 3 adenylate cyclase
MTASPHHFTTAWHDRTEALPTGLTPLRSTRLVHCAMLTVDIAGFGSRDADTQRHLHDNLYQIVEGACENTGLPWPACHHEDRGDGILLIAPPIISAELLDPLAAHLHAALRRHNRHTSTTAKIQLRMAIHAGYIRLEQQGVVGHDVNHLFRLIEATEFKTRFAASQTEFALIASNDLYNAVIQHGPGLMEPANFQQVTINNKETCTPAWIWLPNTVD